MYLLEIFPNIFSGLHFVESKKRRKKRQNFHFEAKSALISNLNLLYRRIAEGLSIPSKFSQKYYFCCKIRISKFCNFVIYVFL